MTYDLTIPPALAGQRLDRALVLLAAEAGADLSRARLQALLAEGQVLRAGKVFNDASGKVKEGEVYHLTIPPLRQAKAEAQDLPISFVYEDDDVIVLNKPAGLVVHPAAGNHDGTLVNALLYHRGEALSGIGGEQRPGIVHRLDKDTSGLMVVAKNDRAHKKLSAQFANRSLSRTYFALVWGTPHPVKGSIEGAIGRDPRNRQRMAVVRGGGKEALTYYEVVQVYGPVSLVRCKLATGRTHQIRVHMAHKKHPLVGDALYGGKRKSAAGFEALAAFPRQALHAAALQFIHPVSGEEVQFEVPMAADMASLISKLTN